MIKRFFSLPKYILWPIYGCLTIFMVISLMLLSGVYWLSSNSGQKYVHNLISGKASSELGYKIDIEDISFHFPVKIHISNIALADKQGKWLEANDIAISILPTPNIYSHCIIHNISANKIILLRKPENPEAQVTNTAKENQNIKISVLKIAVKEAIISASVMELTHDILASVDGSIKWSGLDKRLDFQPIVYIKNISPNLESIQVSSSGTYFTDKGTFNANFKSMINNKIEIVGHTHFSSKNIYLDAKVENLIFSEFIPGSLGNANIKLKIEGSITKPVLNVTARTSNVFYQEKSIPNIVTTINGSLDSNKWLGAINLETENGIKADLSYVEADKIIQFSNIYIGYMKSSIAGDLKLNTDKMLIDGKLETKDLAIEQFKNYLPEPVEGKINIYTIFSSKKGIQEISNNIQLKNFLIREINVSQAGVKVNIPNLRVLEQATIEANLYKVEHKNFTINDIEMKAIHQREQWKVALKAAGYDKFQAFELITNGELCTATINEKKITLNSFKGSYGKNKFSNTNKIIFFSNSKYQSLIIPNLKIDSGEFSLKANLKEEKIDLTSTATHIPVKLFKENLPKQLLDQYFKLNLHIIGEMQNPQVNLDLSIYNSKADKNSKKFDSDIAIKIKDRKAIFNAKSNKDSSLYYNLHGDIPINFSLKAPVILSIEDQAPLSATLDYNFDTSTFAKIFFSSEHKIEGKIFGNLAISGNYSTPLINGEIKCNDGRYENIPFAIKFNNINTDISLKNNLLTVNKLVIKDYKKNELLISGNTNFSNIKNYIYNFQIDTKQFYLTKHHNIHSLISGNIIIKGNNKSGDVKGVINSERLDIYLPDEFSNNIPKLNVTQVISTSSKSKNLEVFNYPIILNVALQAKHKVFIRGWGVDAELGGKLVLKGNMDKPEILGKLSVIRGRYEVFDKRFKLKQAELLFEGNIPPSPYLNIIGSLTKAGIEIRPILYGPIMNPSLEIESSPARPQEEVLSILLFGKDSSKISTFQAIQLANSLKKLSTRKSSGFDPLRQIRDLFGLDDINIDNDSSGAPSVGVEKYVTDNVRVKLNQGKTSHDGSAGVEVDLTPNISVESKSSMSGSNGLGVNWKHDY